MLSLRKEFLLAAGLALLASASVYYAFYKPGPVEDVKVKIKIERQDVQGVFRALASRAIDRANLLNSANGNPKPTGDIIPTLPESAGDLPKVCREAKVSETILENEFKKVYAMLADLPKDAKECLAELRAPATCFAVERRMDSQECLDAVLIARARFVDALTPLEASDEVVLANKIVARVFHKERSFAAVQPEISVLGERLLALRPGDAELQRAHTSLLVGLAKNDAKQVESLLY